MSNMSGVLRDRGLLINKNADFSKVDGTEGILGVVIEKTVGLLIERVAEYIAEATVTGIIKLCRWLSENISSTYSKYFGKTSKTNKLKTKLKSLPSRLGSPRFIPVNPSFIQWMDKEPETMFYMKGMEVFHQNLSSGLTDLVSDIIKVSASGKGLKRTFKQGRLTIEYFSKGMKYDSVMMTTVKKVSDEKISKPEDKLGLFQKDYDSFKGIIENNLKTIDLIGEQLVDAQKEIKSVRKLEEKAKDNQELLHELGYSLQQLKYTVKTYHFMLSLLIEQSENIIQLLENHTK